MAEDIIARSRKPYRRPRFPLLRHVAADAVCGDPACGHRADQHAENLPASCMFGVTIENPTIEQVIAEPKPPGVWPTCGCIGFVGGRKDGGA